MKQLFLKELNAEIAHVYEEDFGFDDIFDISAEMDDILPKYKYAEVGEILGGTLEPVNPKFVVVSASSFVQPHRCTDDLMNIIAARLPKPAEH